MCVFNSHKNEDKEAVSQYTVFQLEFGLRQSIKRTQNRNTITIGVKKKSKNKPESHMSGQGLTRRERELRKQNLS